MSQKLISRSPDLLRLRNEGYDIEIRAAYLLVKSVPYVNSKREVLTGTLVAPLTLAGDVTAQPADHTVMFAGEYPCRENGLPIESIRNSSDRTRLDDGLFIDHRFSNKASTGPDKDFYDKMTRYITILAGPAEALCGHATARIHRFEESTEQDSPFVYLDTASSNAGIASASRKLQTEKIAIVGLGGTGSYVLDLLAKTPVKQIHLFDGDRFLQHNAFRSPGAASCEELRIAPQKVDYFAAKYSNMHRGIVTHDEYIESANVEELIGMDFVFLCLDRGTAKRNIIEALSKWGTPFIDASMGVEIDDGAVGGIVAITTATTDKCDHISRRISLSDADPDADYSRNIQIADLSALNAALAVIRWKKLCGFYRDFTNERYSTFTIDTHVLINEEEAI